MKNFFKKFWKTSYYGFLAFALGLVFLLFAKWQTFFVIFGFLCFIGGGVLNLTLAIKQCQKDSTEINTKIEKIQQILEEENENATQEQIRVNQEVLERLNKDANHYKLTLAINIIIYLGVSVLSLIYLIRSFFIL